MARVGQLGHFVHLTFGEGRRGWVLHHVDAVGIGLHQASARDGVHVLLLDVEGARVGEAIFLEHVPGGEQLVVEDVVQRPRAACAVDRSVHEGDLVHGQPAVERVRNLDDRVLAHAIQQDVGAGVEQDGALELVLPVVVVRQAPQARLDAADDDGLVLEGAADEVAVDRDGAVGTCARASAGGVGVLVAWLLVDGVVVHHRVHVAAADQKAEPGLAQDGDGIGIFPVRLRDDADLVAVGFQNTRDDRVSKRRMIDIRVADDIDKVALCPAAAVHIRLIDGQKFCHRCPFFFGRQPKEGFFTAVRGAKRQFSLAETCQLVQFDPTLLSCAKKRRVEPPRRNCPKKTLQKGFLWTLSETKGLRPF